MKKLVFSLIMCIATQCTAQQFYGAYGWAPYAGQLNRGARSGNVLYGGIGTYYGGYQVYMGNRYRGYNNAQARAYLRWRRQYRGALDTPMEYTMLDWERDLFNALWDWEQRFPCKER